MDNINILSNWLSASRSQPLEKHFFNNYLGLETLTITQEIIIMKYFIWNRIQTHIIDK